MVIKIELGQRIVGPLPEVNSFCLALVKREGWNTSSWELGYWRYEKSELFFRISDGNYFFLEEIKAWIELPKELENE